MEAEWMEGLKGYMKQHVKNVLVNRQQKKYDRLLEAKTLSYDVWMKGVEKELAERKRPGSSFSVKRVPYDACKEYFMGKAVSMETAEAVLFVDSQGKVNELAEELIGDFFIDHPEVNLLYGDEDVMSPDGGRYTPWLKPDWSPDTFLSSFYFGSVFAVRAKALQKLTHEQKEWIFETADNSIYRLCYLLAKECGGFEKRQRLGSGAEDFSFPVGHVDEILFHAFFNRESEMNQWELTLKEDREGEKGKISVIIPSKDHSEILKRCIASLKKTRKADSRITYEIIVVDNGSQEETKRELEKWFAEEGITYLYKQMPFHFSQMCNMGAEMAAGDVLLFLNDDVEVPMEITEEGEDFLQTMYEAAVRPYTGAVGAKLYYPNSKRIQHAGIVNLSLGPVHKLQFKEDTESFYYGWNRKMRNVIAVTGACLAVAKDRFIQAGGFPEELPVAFNDVDLCFTLFEKGYYNVVLQDVFLYHYESLSRGNDDSREKLNRLLTEKEKLYERHPKMCGTDSFYHKYFATDMLSTGFELKSDDWGGQPAHKAWKSSKVGKAGKLTEGAREDACVMVSLEYAGSMETAGHYLIQGYSFVAGSDNACYEKKILLEREHDEAEEGGNRAAEELWYAKPLLLPRKDVEENLPDQVNVGLTGFRVYLKKGDLPAGTYRIGVYVKDCCTGGKLYSWTNRYLTI